MSDTRQNTRSNEPKAEGGHTQSLVAHDYMGCCPDEQNGPDARDPQCAACVQLMARDRIIAAHDELVAALRTCSQSFDAGVRQVALDVLAKLEAS